MFFFGRISINRICCKIFLDSYNLSILTKKKMASKLSDIWSGFSSYFFIHPRSKGKKCSGSRIQDPDPQHCCQQTTVPWHTLRYSPCPTETWGPRRYHDIRYGTHLVRQTHEGRGGTMTYVTLLTLSDRHMRAAVVPWHTLRYSPCPTDTWGPRRYHDMLRYSPCPTDTWGPRRPRSVKRIICRLANMKSMMKVWTPTAMIMTTATPDSCSRCWGGGNGAASPSILAGLYLGK